MVAMRKTDEQLIQEVNTFFTVSPGASLTQCATILNTSVDRLKKLKSAGLLPNAPRPMTYSEASKRGRMKNSGHAWRNTNGRFFKPKGEAV